MILPSNIKEYNKIHGKLIELIPYQMHYKNRADRLLKIAILVYIQLIFIKRSYKSIPSIMM